MKYNKIVEGIFIKRPNRFIAHVIIEGKEEIVHVKIQVGVRNCLYQEPK